MGLCKKLIPTRENICYGGGFRKSKTGVELLRDLSSELLKSKISLHNVKSLNNLLKEPFQVSVYSVIEGNISEKLFMSFNAFNESFLERSQRGQQLKTKKLIQTQLPEVIKSLPLKVFVIAIQHQIHLKVPITCKLR